MSDTIAAVLYYRVSTEEQSRRGFSLPEQRKECIARAESLARQRGCDLQVFEFEDAASGEILERPGLEACREFYRNNPVHYFICLDPDRFSRSLFNQLLVTEEIERRGVELQFVQHNYEATPEGRLFYQMRGAISEYEKSKIRERTSRGRRGKLAAGGIPNYVEPWGYTWDKQAKTLQVDPEKANWVRQVFEWCVEGMTYQRIADRLTELGVAPPKRGQAWYKNVVYKILQNPVYAGQLVLNKGSYAGLTPLRKVPKEKRRALSHSAKPQEEWVTVAVPSIIPEDLWQRTQGLLSRRRRLSQRGIGLLSGLCICALCGQPVHYASQHGRRYLRCYGRYPHLKDARREVRAAQSCTLAHIPAEKIEAEVWDRVCLWFTNEDELKKAQAAQQDRHPEPVNGERISVLRKHLEAREVEYRRAFELAVKGLAPQGFEADLRRLKAEVSAIQKELEAETQQQANTGPSLDLPVLSAYKGMVRSELENLETEEQRLFVRGILRQVRIWPNDWEPVFPR